MTEASSTDRPVLADSAVEPSAPTDRAPYVLVRRAVHGGPVRDIYAEDGVWPLDKALRRLARQNGYLQADGSPRWELAAVVPVSGPGPGGAWATVDASEIRPGDYLGGTRVLGTAPGEHDDEPGTVLVDLGNTAGPEALRAGDPETVFRPDPREAGP